MCAGRFTSRIATMFYRCPGGARRTPRMAVDERGQWDETDGTEILPHRPEAMFMLKFADVPEDEAFSCFLYEADRGSDSSKTVARKLRGHFDFLVKQRRHQESLWRQASEGSAGRDQTSSLGRDAQADSQALVGVRPHTVSYSGSRILEPLLRQRPALQAAERGCCRRF